MKKTRMRVWSILLTVLMLLTLLPISAMAAEAPVAMIGETTYTSLYDAVAQARDGDTIKLLSDASGRGIIIDSSKYATKGLTIDFNDFTYTVDESPLAGSSGTKSQCFQLLTGGKVTMKGGTVNSTNPGVAMVLQNYCDLTLDGMVIDGSGMTRTDGTYTMSNNCGNVVIKDTTVIAKEGDVAFDVYGGFSDYSDVTVTVTGSSVIDGKVEVARGSGTQADGSKNKNTLNIEGGTFNNEIAVTDNENTSVTVTGGSFTSSVKDYVEENSSAVAVTDSSSTKYYVGTSEALTEMIQNAAPGTTVEVEAGSIQAGQVPDGVTVVGTGSGSVTVDKDEATYTVTVIKAATCTANGIVKYTNTADPSDYYYVSIPASHKWELTEIIKAATCGEDGEAKYTCSVCSTTENREIPATGEHEFEENMVDATCTENAKVGMVCKNCGATEGEMEEVPETALGHDLQEDPESLVEPTCTEAGSVTLKCSRCDYTEEKEIPATGHVPGEPEMEEPTCTENGKSVVKCTVCGEVIESADLGDLAPATGHTPEAMEEVAATCTAAGSTGGVKCSVCNTVLEEPTVVPVDPSAHNYELTNALKQPTCSTPGIGVYKCLYCEETVYQAIPTLPHTWDEGTETTAPTCTEEGVLTFECEVCQATKTEPIQPTGHTYGNEQVSDDNLIVYKECVNCGHREIIANLGCAHENSQLENAKEATCTEAGYTGDLVCQNCGATIQPGEPIPAAGHTEEIIPGKAATCTETGLTEGKKCSVCGEVLVAQETIPMVAHNYVDGVCTVCGAEDPDYVAPCTHENTQLENVKEATCTEAGYTGDTVCTDCGETLQTGSVIPATGHTVVTDAAVEATCTTDGKTEGSHCSACGAVIVAQETIPATGHTEEVIPGKAATCTETGLTEGKKCSVCGEVLVEQEVLPMVAHHYEDGVCTVCGAEDPDYVAPCTHENTETKNAVAATCTEDGYTGDLVCQDCGATIETGTVIPAAGHTVVTDAAVEATCTTDGKTEGSHCSACGTVIVAQETVPAKGHTVVEVPEVPATEESAGTTAGTKCSVCGEILSGCETIPPLSHEHVWDGGVETKAPTCTEAGEMTYTCSACGETRVETIAPKGHSYKVTVSYNSDYTEVTYTYTCSACGDSYSETVPL